MAELQRVGGRLESHRSPAGRRILLPAEAELCNAVGITEEEYWLFVEQLERYNGQRPEGYELIPDVRNDPVSLIINLVIGIALSAVSALLAPKPKQQKERPQLETASVQGRSRFAPQQGFDSVQDLASLGAVIPLIFANRNEADGNVGGVRVQSQLMFSQMLSRGVGQRLQALMAFSNGDIQGRPDFAGYAIGDTSLKNYTNAKISLYFKDGSANSNRILQGDGSQYPEATLELGMASYYDVFAIWDDRYAKHVPWFSGTRTPSTQTQFGLFAPMPNGMAYQLNWELVMVVDGSGSETKKNARKKREKINVSWPYYAAIVGVGNPQRPVSPHNGPVYGTNDSRWDYIVYQIYGKQENTSRYDPWGVEDVNQSTTGARVEADDSISVGELYMAGDALVVCTVAPNDVWTPGKTLSYTFDVIEPGYLECRSLTQVTRPHGSATLQRCAVATITNTRSCMITEIGIKSTVWKQINGFSNVNSYPGKKVQQEFEHEGGQLSIGSITKYIKRLSFFILEVRGANTDGPWVNISDGTLFCVMGRTPQAQYNFIRVHQPFGQWEFRLKPYPGVLARRYYQDKDVWLMTGTNATGFNSNGMGVAFSGVRTRLTANLMSNPEWILGNADYQADGRVTQLSRTQQGNIPTRIGWVLKEDRYEYDGDEPRDGYHVYRYRDSNNFNMIVRYTWDSSEVVDLEIPFYESGDLPPAVLDGNDKNIQYRPGDVKFQSGPVTYRSRWAIQKWAMEQTYDTPAFDGVVNAIGGSGSGLSVNLRRWPNGSAEWSIRDDGQGYNTGESVTFSNGGHTYTATVTADDRLFLQDNLLPYDAINDYFQYNAENSSHSDRPEHEIAYVNEQVENTPPADYRRLAYAGLRMDSSVEWNQLTHLLDI